MVFAKPEMILRADSKIGQLDSEFSTRLSREGTWKGEKEMRSPERVDQEVRW